MPLVTWLQATALSTAIRESDWLFPAIESLHVIAFVLVVGSIFIVDLRLVGLASRNRRLEDLTAEILPLTWAAFAVAAIAGVLLFAAKAETYVKNGYFVAKLGLLALAGVNMTVYHVVVHRRFEGLPVGGREPPAAKVSGLVSLALWIGVVACGRWIGFTTLR